MNARQTNEHGQRPPGDDGTSSPCLFHVNPRAGQRAEQHFARQICLALDAGTQALSPTVAERLRAARERALAQQSVAVASPQIVGAGGTALLHAGHDGHHPFRAALAILALLLGVALSYYWNGFTQADVHEEIDSALLADDLPPDAYLDPGFQAWFSHYVQETVR